MLGYICNMTQIVYCVFILWYEFNVYYVSLWWQRTVYNDKWLGEGIKWAHVAQVSKHFSARDCVRESQAALPGRWKQALDREIRGRKALCALWGRVSQTPQLKGDCEPGGLGCGQGLGDSDMGSAQEAQRGVWHKEEVWDGDGSILALSALFFLGFWVAARQVPHSSASASRPAETHQQDTRGFPHRGWRSPSDPFIFIFFIIFF